MTVRKRVLVLLNVLGAQPQVRLPAGGLSLLSLAQMSDLGRTGKTRSRGHSNITA
jgi:hypothetical protein